MRNPKRLPSPLIHSLSLNWSITPDEIKSLKKENKDNPTMMELLERLEYSEMENACLKKLATLVQARKEKSQKQSKN